MKLLLIDDGPLPATWMRRRLEFENNQVVVSPDWPTAWKMIRKARYDVILMPVLLSEIDPGDLSGWGPVETLGVPLVLIISPDTPGNRAWGLESGADDCVGSMIDSRELNARLYALYRRKAGQFISSSPLRIDDLELNVFDKTAHRGGKRIDLLPREYNLLRFLLENQGRVVSKKEILDYVWHKAKPVSPNAVEVYINYLRNKIDDSTTAKLIHTVKGVGYIVRIRASASE